MFGRAGGKGGRRLCLEGLGERVEGFKCGRVYVWEGLEGN